MSKPMKVEDAIVHLLDMATSLKNMRNIINNPHAPSDLKYRAAITEDHLLDVMKLYCDHIEQLKGIGVNIKV